MIGVVGINHKMAPVHIRELITLSEIDIAEFSALLKEERDIKGLVILSTCNRTEIYFHQAKNCTSSISHAILKSLIAFKKIHLEIAPYFYTYNQHKAVTHLFQVTAGMDSLIIGEDQIIGQVKQAFSLSVLHEANNRVMNRLFHKAFSVGKKVRAKTAINQGISSVSYAAIALAEQLLTNFQQTAVLLVGTGDIGELVIKALHEKGIKNITVANRTIEKAEAIAQLYQAHVIPIEEVEQHLLNFDIVLTSTASNKPIIKTKHCQDSLSKLNRPLFLFDLSMPRNIEESLKSFAHIHLYNIDDLQLVVDTHMEKRKAELVKAKIFIDEGVTDFFEWLNTTNLSPTITALQEKLTAILDTRLTYVKAKVSEEELIGIEENCRYLKEKYVRMIIKNLKQVSNNGRNEEYIELVNKLFELNKSN